MRRLLSSTLALAALGLLLGSAVLPVPQPLLAQESANWTGKKVYMSEAFGEPSRFDRSAEGISRFAGILRLLGAEVFTLEWRRAIPADADLVLVIGPAEALSVDAEARLWAYLQTGGNVLLVADALDARGRRSRALPEASGFFSLSWTDLGLQAQNLVVVAEGAVRQIEITESDDEGNVTSSTSVEAPELSLEFRTTLVDPEHPVTWQLAAASALAESSPDENGNSAHQLYFKGARPIQLDPALQQFITPLIFVRENNIYGESDYDGYVSSGGVVEYNIGTDSARGNLILAAAVEEPGSGGRMILLGDADFLKNGAGFASAPAYSQGFLYPANVQFMINVTNWMLESSAPMPSFPTPAATSTVTITPSPTMTNTPRPEVTATPTPAA